MAVRKEPSGRRSVEVEIELPGTPEEVWRAIATGPGISTWFARTDVEEREGGTVAFHLGPGMDSGGIVTAWEPPRRFVFEERAWAPGAPPLATELVVEARAGGTCLVRLVHSLFASGDDWDGQLEGMEAGWPWFFDVLRLMLGDFRGQPASALRVTGPAAGSEADVWDALVRALGFTSAATGQRPGVAAPDVPSLDGVIQRVGASPRVLSVRLDRPAPGAGLFFVHTWNDQVFVVVSLHFFGSDAPAAAAREEPRWRDWLEQASLVARCPASEGA